MDKDKKDNQAPNLFKAYADFKLPDWRNATVDGMTFMEYIEKAKKEHESKAKKGKDK